MLFRERLHAPHYAACPKGYDVDSVADSVVIVDDVFQMPVFEKEGMS
jgi:hypothetical protein